MKGIKAARTDCHQLGFIDKALMKRNLVERACTYRNHLKNLGRIQYRHDILWNIT